MANKYGIRAEVEREIRARDRVCVYCGKKMKIGHSKDKPTIEHLNNIPHDYYPKDLTGSDLATCCQQCNSSRGDKHYWDWFKTLYCNENDINKTTVANVVKKYIKKYPTERKFK